MRVLFAGFYSSVETLLCTQMEKLLGVEHFRVSAIYSSAYIPPIEQVRYTMSTVTFAVDMIHALNSSTIFTLWLYT
jgi:hypothetical protein